MTGVCYEENIGEIFDTMDLIKWYYEASMLGLMLLMSMYIGFRLWKMSKDSLCMQGQNVSNGGLTKSGTL